MSPAWGVFQGVIRVHLLEAEKLAQMDHFLGIRGKSDPYAKVSIGLQHFRSKTVYKNLSPTWNEVFEVRVPSAAASVSFGLHSGSCWGQAGGLALRGLMPVGNSGHRSGPGGWTGGSVSFPLPKPTASPEVGCCGPGGTSYR